MLSIIHAGTERRKRFRHFSPRGSCSRIGAIVRRPGEGGRKGSVSCGSLGGSSIGRAEKLTYISTVLASEEKEQLRHVLLGNKDIFAWSRLDMAGIDPTLASHKLNVIATTKLVRQKVRRPDRHRIIQIEMDKLLSAGFIREVKYPEWLANVVSHPE